MESFEATKAVFTRLQTIDPENASKIIGYVLLHHGEKDMIHLAYGPETLLISLVNRAKTDLGLSSNISSASVVSPISNPIAISRPNPLSLSLSSPRLHNNGFNPSSPSSPSIWSPHHHSLSPNSNNISYAGAVVNGSSCNISRENSGFLDDCHLQDSNLGPFLDNPLNLATTNLEFPEQSLDYPYWDNSSSSSNGGENNSNFLHRRSSSFNDAMYFGTDDSTSGFGFKPCLYYARGFCKNGNSCKFVHGAGGGCNGGFSDDNINCGGGHIGGSSPCNFDAFEQCQEEIFRTKLAHQHRLAAQLMANGVNLPYNKLNFIHNEAQRSAAAFVMGEEFHKMNRARMARNDFAAMDCNPGSRQIYLTFPADSTFKEEDVSSYFSRYGPVQDVRIPYQQKRMFGFVTFVYPDTVKAILAKGNPHFVCESRVLVKPYKEKGKLPDKKHNHQQLERGENFTSSPSAHDCRDPYDFGGRMLYSAQELMLKKKLEEQAELQHALDLQERGLMNLKLSEANTHHGSALSPDHLQAPVNQTAQPPSSRINQEYTEEVKAGLSGSSDEEIADGVNSAKGDSNGNVPKKEDTPYREDNELFDSFENVLPDNLFASPKKLASDTRPAAFSPALAELDNGAATTGSSSTTSEDSSTPAISSLGMTPVKSCFFEMPRISTGHGALGM